MKLNLETRVARCIQRNILCVGTGFTRFATNASCHQAARAVIRMVKRELARRPK